LRIPYTQTNRVLRFHVLFVFALQSRMWNDRLCRSPSHPPPRLALTDSPSDTRSLRIFVFCSVATTVLYCGLQLDGSIERDTGERKTGGTGRLFGALFRGPNFDGPSVTLFD